MIDHHLQEILKNFKFKELVKFDFFLYLNFDSYIY